MTNTATTEHPLSGTYRTLASGTIVLIDYKGVALPTYEEDDYYVPTCSICDGAGHGYVGGPPCPLEVGGEDDPREEWLQGMDDIRRGYKVGA